MVAQVNPAQLALRPRKADSKNDSRYKLTANASLTTMLHETLFTFPFSISFKHLLYGMINHSAARTRLSSWSRGPTPGVRVALRIADANFLGGDFIWATRWYRYSPEIRRRVYQIVARAHSRKELSRRPPPQENGFVPI